MFNKLGYLVSQLTADKKLQTRKEAEKKLLETVIKIAVVVHSLAGEVETVKVKGRYRTELTP